MYKRSYVDDFKFLVPIILMIGAISFTSITCIKNIESQKLKLYDCKEVHNYILTLDLERHLTTYDQIKNKNTAKIPYMKNKYLNVVEISKEEYIEWVGHVEGGFGKSTTHGPLFQLTISGEICEGKYEN